MADQKNRHPSVQAWAIHNILAFMAAALPDDAIDALPVRSTLYRLTDMAEALAIELGDMEVRHA